MMTGTWLVRRERLFRRLRLGRADTSDESGCGIGLVRGGLVYCGGVQIYF